MTIAVVARVDAYNNWARAQNWPSLCDPSLAFEADILADLLAVWRREAGSTIPRRSAMSARTLKPHLGNVAILERTAKSPARYQMRLMGTRLAHIIGDLQGRYLDEVVPPDLLVRWHAALDLTLAEGRPLRFTNRVDFRGLNFLQAELLLAPLLGTGDLPSMVLGAAVFKSHVTPTGEAVLP